MASYADLWIQAAASWVGSSLVGPLPERLSERTEKVRWNFSLRLSQ
jgi:hypothetical protein